MARQLCQNDKYEEHYEDNNQNDNAPRAARVYEVSYDPPGNVYLRSCE